MIAENLEAVGMTTQVFYRAAQVLPFLRQQFANLLLLDINLPDLSGMDLVRQLKEAGQTIPVIFLTANTNEDFKVSGLELGGDDYITKPFSFPELVARIRAVLRRSETAWDQHVTRNATLDQGPFPFCGATILPDRMEASLPNGSTVSLGRKELGILTHLHLHRGAVITRRSLIHAVWGIHADTRSRSLDQYIVKIRTVFQKGGCCLDSFRTIHGVGYSFDLESGAGETTLEEPSPAGGSEPES